MTLQVLVFLYACKRLASSSQGFKGLGFLDSEERQRQGTMYWRCPEIEGVLVEGTLDATPHTLHPTIGNMGFCGLAEWGSQLQKRNVQSFCLFYI